MLNRQSQVQNVTFAGDQGLALPQWLVPLQSQSGSVEPISQTGGFHPEELVLLRESPTEVAKSKFLLKKGKN